MIIETTTYRFEIDDTFTGRTVDFEGGSTWDGAADRTVQLPIFNFALSEIKDLTDEFGGEGVSYDQTVRAYFAIKRPRIASFDDEERIVAGRRALVRRAFSPVAGVDHGAAESPAIFHLFVNIPLDDEFMHEFSADCPIGERDRYEPLFWKAIESIQWLGGFRGHRIGRRRRAKSSTNGSMRSRPRWNGWRRPI